MITSVDSDLGAAWPMFRNFALRLRIFTIFLLSLGLLPTLYAREPKWTRISSSHFAILSDAGRTQSDEAALRFEQMYTLFGQLLVKNSVNLSQPLDIIVLRDQNEYENAAPLRNGKPITEPAFLIPGNDRLYIVLDASRRNNWRAISYPFARWLLNYNYPPTPAWFDEGFAAYFSSVDFQEKQTIIGGEPQSDAGPPPAVTGRAYPKSPADMLSTLPWIPLPELFQMKAPGAATPQQRRTMFRAESWIVVHYLFEENKMPELGAYFGSVEGQHTPVAEAIQTAFGISAAQLEQYVKDYFQKQMQSRNVPEGTPAGDRLAHTIPPPESGLGVGTSEQDVPTDQAQALLAEMELRLPSRQAEAKQQIDSLGNDGAQVKAIVRRALAWLELQNGDFNAAKQDLDRAFAADQNDAMAHYYFAQLQYRTAMARGGRAPELANMLVGLREVIDKYPEFAEAHNLLAVARIEGGGLNSALDAIHTAMQLAPRCEDCLLHLAQIYLGLKKWDQAKTLMDRLKDNPDPQIARTASQALKDLPYLMKYGIAPSEEAQNQASSEEESGDGDEETATAALPKPAPKIVPDKRPVKFLHAELLSVDCSNSPQAILRLSIHGRIHTIHVEDFNNVAVIGADKFSCMWKDQKVALNYKGEISRMNLISIEVD